MSDSAPHEEAVFNAVLKLPVGERAAYLQSACGGDAQLRARVAALLQAIGQPVGSDKTVLISFPLTEKPGDKIGRYKLLEQIGEGGFGVVYVADQQEPVRRRVALKVIKLGMDTKEVIARFEAERQALAMMDHPNIAKVLDAGATDSGRPYFVMELVKGDPVTEYCDKNNLTTRQRIDLFVQICQAIQHAHQKGIIHRDIKPSNILVTMHDGAPVPKVIDFGIAKATEQRLTDKTVFTALEQMIGTPAYMSPEQAERSGIDIDTRSDIYSLGVLLYELLTGTTPFDPHELVASGVEAMRRTIREREPQRPSARLTTMVEGELTATAKHRQVDPPKLVHAVRGDLDWIVMNCLEKDRTRRYETANELASDLQRHVNNELVMARPPSNVYRFQKLVRRHKLVVAAASTVIGVLIIGLGASTWFLLRERQARQEAAAAHANEAILRQKLRESVRQYAEVQTKVRQEVLGQNAAEVQQRTYEELSRQLGIDPKVLQEKLPQFARELKNAPESSTYERANAAYVAKEYSEAERLALAAADAAKTASPPKTHDAVKDLELAGNSADARIEFADALRHFRDAEQLTDRARDPLEWAGQAWNIATVLSEQGRYAEAEKAYRSALEEYRRARGDEDKDVFKLRNYLTLALFGQRKNTDAETECRELLKLETKALGPEHPETLCSRHNLAVALYRRGNFAAAENEWREVLTLREKVLGTEHPDTLRTRNDLALVLGNQGKYAEAETEDREVIRIQEKVLGPEHPDTLQSRYTLALALREQGNYAEAERNFREVLALQEKVLGLEHPDTFQTSYGLALCLRSEKKFDEAKLVAQHIAEEGQKVLGANDNRTRNYEKLWRELQPTNSLPP